MIGSIMEVGYVKTDEINKEEHVGKLARGVQILYPVVRHGSERQ